MAQSKKTTKSKKATKTIPALVPGTRFLPLGWEKSGVTLADFVVMGSWKNLDQWNCALCAWNTLDGENEVLEHIRLRHIQPEPAKPESGILIAKK